MKTLTKILGVGGLVAALSGCVRKHSFEEDVRTFALVNGWKNFDVALVQEDTSVCRMGNLYSVTGTSPGGNNDTGYVCCGPYDVFWAGRNANLPGEKLK